VPFVIKPSLITDGKGESKLNKEEFDEYVANLNKPKAPAASAPAKKRGRPKLVRPSTAKASTEEPLAQMPADERRVLAADRIRTRVRPTGEQGFVTDLGGNCESAQYFHGKTTH
jgi:hypothetical protein